jgi:hypothetical protein
MAALTHASVWAAMLCGIGQILTRGGFPSQLAKAAMAKLFLETLPEFVRLTEQTPSTSLFWALAFMVHGDLGFDAI